MYKIKTLRGTMFCAPVKFSKEIVKSLSDVLIDFMPVIVRDNNIFPSISPWQMTSPDEREVLLFNGDKIDLIKVFAVELSDDVIVSFVERCKVVFEKIMSITGYASTRIALAPTVVVTENGIRPDALYNRLFGITDFQNSQPAISNVSQVFRVNKTIGGNDIMINHVANFHSENEVMNVNGRNQLVEQYLCDFDINTMVNPNYRFGIEEMKEFFNISIVCFRDYYNLYMAN